MRIVEDLEKAASHGLQREQELHGTATTHPSTVRAVHRRVGIRQLQQRQQREARSSRTTRPAGSTHHKAEADERQQAKDDALAVQRGRGRQSHRVAKLRVNSRREKERNTAQTPGNEAAESARTWLVMVHR